MRPLDHFLAAVPGGGREMGGQWFCRCPVHPDKRPSLVVRERADDSLLVFCHAGCLTEDVLESLDLAFADLYPERTWT